MALIARDNFLAETSQSATSWTGPYTVTGANPAIVVFAECALGQTVTSATYGGIALVQVDTTATYVNLTTLILVGCPTGSNTLTVNFSDNANHSVSAESYSGVYVGSSTGGSDAHNKTAWTTTGGNQSLVTTTATNNAWITCKLRANSGSYAASTNVSIQNNVSNVSLLADTGAPITPPGATTQTFTNSTGTPTGIITSVALTSIDGSSTAPRYWVGGTGTWDNSATTHWSSTSGGTAGATAPTATTSDVFFDANSGGGIVTYTGSVNLINITFTGFTGTLAGSSNITTTGNLTLGSAMSVTYTGNLTFSGTSSQTITSVGKTLLSSLTFNSSTGTWTLQDALTCKTITLTSGILSPQSFTITLTGTGTVFSAGGGLFTAGTSTIKITDASSSSKTFAGGGLTYGNLWITGSGTGTYTISGSNTFNDFKVDTPPHTVNFTAGTTQKVATFTVNGTAGNLMTLQSTSGGSSWNLVKIGSGVVSCDYLSIQDSHSS